MSLLPKHSTFDTVRTGAPVVRRNWFVRTLTCPHEHSTHFVHIDHRAGPGSFADNFEGIVCCRCGHVLAKQPFTHRSLM